MKATQVVYAAHGVVVVPAWRWGMAGAAQERCLQSGIYTVNTTQLGVCGCQAQDAAEPVTQAGSWNDQERFPRNPALLSCRPLSLPASIVPNSLITMMEDWNTSQTEIRKYNKHVPYMHATVRSSQRSYNHQHTNPVKWAKPNSP